MIRFINEQIQTGNEEVIVNYEPESFFEILIKLARGIYVKRKTKFLKVIVQVNVTSNINLISAKTLKLESFYS